GPDRPSHGSIRSHPPDLVPPQPIHLDAIPPAHTTSRRNAHPPVNRFPDGALDPPRHGAAVSRYNGITSRVTGLTSPHPHAHFVARRGSGPLTSDPIVNAQTNAVSSASAAGICQPKTTVPDSPVTSLRCVICTSGS